MKSTKELFSIIDKTSVDKVNMSRFRLLVLSILAGIYISFGSIFYTTVVSYGDSWLSTKFLGGIVFSLGLVLVVVAGAELFTGNILMVISRLNNKISSIELVKNWSLVYLGNFIGAMLMVVVMFFSEQYFSGDSIVGAKIVQIATKKVSLSFVTALMRAILCNILVCLAVWMALRAVTVSGKVLTILFPITTFVAMGFEHSIANMYFIPMGMLIKSNEVLNLASFFISNLLPVTLGNIVGGSVFVGAAYWISHTNQEEIV